MNTAIIIGGGVGPMAGLRLHRLILENTRTSGRDQDHLKIIHMCLSDLIPDRTDALFEGAPEKPAIGMADVIAAGGAACGEMGLSMIAGIPCNTFHAAPIWEKFMALLRQKKSSGSVLNMIDETVDHIRKTCPDLQSIGVLSTSGTRNLGIYSGPLIEAGYEVLEPEEQEEVHRLIYDKKWGIKAGIEISDRAKNSLIEQVNLLIERGAGLIILGCTELPLALEGSGEFPVPLLDPMVCLAHSLIRQAEPGKLK